MSYYKKCNLITGWFAFAISALVYLLSMEPTTSLWDCAEFIATSYKLEVGHPPGAPLFMMIARFFTIFAPSTEYVAVMVNTMSSLASAFTILFLFWTITHLARKIYSKDGQELSKSQIWTIMGAGLIGSIAYTFTDTFWFSAIEGEVYAMSSMFTALVVWAMLQWENVADEPRSNRWLILIAYFMGLSIGIHILNLLTIPALVFIYYFKKYPVITKWGVVKATLISGGIIVAINYILVPYSVAAGALVDKLFVNGFGLPINSGMVFFSFVVFAALGWGIYYTHKKAKVIANSIILCTTVIILGFSTYASVTIRAIADPPMNSNNANNPYALLSLLQRDQYGERPLLYGPYYSSPPIDWKEKTVIYVNDEGKYDTDEVIRSLEYPGEFKYLFPRTYSRNARHIEGYKSWGNITGRKVRYGDEMITVPTAGENVRYFFSYQLNFMYWRYFLWNFVGRQNDIQGNGDLLDGNWISGIKFIDEIYLGPQDNLPSEMANNKARNKYYFLPFLLGLAGLIYQLNKDKRNFTVVMWLFLMMGIVLVLYFNTTPGEPRERDYVYAGSFYAFCMWIGFGVLWLKDLITKFSKKDTVMTAVAATVVCSSVPIILGAQNWDDHDRSHRYVARDLGWNYLQSTLPNSIIINYGDNDTFPLWYNQEVEGVRTDVKVMNSSYLLGDWYIDQMKIKSNEADPVPFSIPRDMYVNSRNESIDIYPRFDRPIDIKQVIDFVVSDNPNSKIDRGFGPSNYIPTRQIALPVNKENAIACGIVKAKDAHLMEDTVIINLEGNSLIKNDLMFLDMLANFDWKRPIHFTQVHNLAPLGLLEYLQFDGFSYRLVPIKTEYTNFQNIGRVDTEVLYENLMNVFRYGNVADPRVYTDYFIQYNYRVTNSRSSFARLAKQLVAEGDTVRAIEVLDAGIEKLPFSQIFHSYTLTVPVIEAYYMAGATDKANAIFDDYANNLMEYVNYLIQFRGTKAELISSTLEEKIAYLDALYRLANTYRQREQVDKLGEFYSMYGL